MDARVWLVVLSCVAAGFAFSATGHHPYEFYTITRGIVFLAVALGVYLHRNRFWKSPAIAYVIIGIIFNPFLPLHLSRTYWHNLDITAGVVLILSLAFVRQIRQSN